MLQENHCTEFKSALNDKFEKAIVAFLNSRDGGSVYIGIDDFGTVIGVNNPDAVQLEITSRLRDKILPATLGLYEIRTLMMDNKHVIQVKVASGPEKPYYIRDKGMSPAGCFTRVGSASIPMDVHQINELYANHVTISLKNIRSPWDSLQFNQLKLYYEGHHHPLNDQFLKSLELLTSDNHFNYVAYLVADENANSVRVAKYAGTDKLNLIENAEYGMCSLMKTTDRILEKMLVENRVFCKITPSFRIEKETFNMIALREIVINAIVHNDYSQEYTPIFEFFSDRLEITSYGGLQTKQSESDMFSGASMPRNRILMRIFRDLDYVESIGSGMARILNAYGRDIYDIQEHYIRITIPYATADGSIDVYSTSPDHDAGEINHETGEINHETGEINHKTGEINHETGEINHETGEINHETGEINHETGEINHETGEINAETGEIKEVMKEILKVIADKPGIKRAKLHELSGISLRTLDRLLSALTKGTQPKIIYRGSKKTGGWYML